MSRVLRKLGIMHCARCLVPDYCIEYYSALDVWCPTTVLNTTVRSMLVPDYCIEYYSAFDVWCPTTVLKTTVRSMFGARILY
ncbi:hypothetical protein DPMN_016901 [Dreissena polymorpha]|uniref:Uncharacterized protein n=1 Tax=Dreissena polymorpha TaxID=45954 RepID=A0A9D4NAH7_DREPO|nr:hypothetical protein DPMN_016901 [Dreissena polymorpha]